MTVLTISRNMGHPRRVVITGMGVVTALGDTPGAVLVGAVRGPERRRAAHAVRHDRVQGPLRRPGPRLGPRRAVRRQGSAAPRSLRAVRHGRQPSRPSRTPGSTSRTLPAEQCGVIIGSGIGGLNEFETQHTDDDAERAVADQPVHDPQADGQRGQRPGLDPLGPARARARRWPRPAPRRPTRSATPSRSSRPARPT